jgi:hypothetical protein
MQIEKNRQKTILSTQQRRDVAVSVEENRKRARVDEREYSTNSQAANSARRYGGGILS